MEKFVAGAPQTSSADIASDNLERLKALFPEVYAEGKVDFAMLRQILGSAVGDSEEKYGLNWHGKRRARQLALTPSTGTLRPCTGESVNWDKTQNLMIEGDNLEVLKLLQKGYSGRIRVIYIDPPYNTGRDFIYPDNYRNNIENYLKITAQIGGDNRKLSSNPESSGRFHTDWLNMMYPRLILARNLLIENGLIFISCDDNESSNLRCVLDEIFGAENFLSQIVWKKSYGGGSKTKHVVRLHEYTLCYCKQKESLDRLELPPDPKALKYYKLRDSKYATRGPYRLQPLATTSNDLRKNLRYKIPYEGEDIWPEKQWQWKRERTMKALEDDELVVTSSEGRKQVYYKQYLKDEEGSVRGAKPYSVLNGPYTQQGTAEIEEIFGDPKIFPFPKPSSLIAQFVSYGYPSNDFIVLDFFSGSGSTCEAVFRLNQQDGGQRRVISVQIPAPTGRTDFTTISAIARERVRRVGSEITSNSSESVASIDVGFRVFKLDTSNIRAWNPRSDMLEDALLAGLDHIESGRTEQDILYELLLKFGLDLCVPIEERTIANKSVHAVGAGTLIACLDKSISNDEVEPLALGIADWHDVLDPAGESTVVFRDSGFGDDVAKTNLTAILEQRGLRNVRSL